MSDLIDRQAAIDALWKALYEYEDRTEKQFQDSDELDVEDWIQHRIFVQNMSDIDRQTIMDLPSAEPKKGKWIIHDESANAYECSCCGLAWCLFDGEPKDNNMNYCPKCGADMRGEE